VEARKTGDYCIRLESRITDDRPDAEKETRP